MCRREKLLLPLFIMEYTDILTSCFMCSVYEGPLHFDMIMWLLCAHFLLLPVTFYTWWRHQNVLFIISHTQSQSVLENNSTWREKLLSFHFQKPKTRESSSEDLTGSPTRTDVFDQSATLCLFKMMQSSPELLHRNTDKIFDS